jgi:hypothetical protein
VMKAENEQLYNRREAYRRTITDLQDRLAAHGAAIAANPSVSRTFAEGRVLEATLERVRAEAEAVEAEVDGWRKARFPSSSQTHELSIATDELPNIGTATRTLECNVSELPEPLRMSAELLGLIVVRVGDLDEDVFNHTPEDLRDESGIWFRMPRRMTLALYDRALASSGSFTLRRLIPAWVVDARSRLNFLRVDSGFLGSEKGLLEFGASGSLVGLSKSSESTARRVAEAISAAPAQIKESVSAAAEVSDLVDKLRTAGASRRLADIKRRKEILEAEIAEKGVLATRAQREKLEELKVQAEVSEVEEKLAPAQPPSPNKELEAQIARAKLERDLKKLEVELVLLRDPPQ